MKKYEVLLNMINNSIKTFPEYYIHFEMFLLPIFIMPMIETEIIFIAI